MFSNGKSSIYFDKYRDIQISKYIKYKIDWYLFYNLRKFYTNSVEIFLISF